MNNGQYFRAFTGRWKTIPLERCLRCDYFLFAVHGSDPETSVLYHKAVRPRRDTHPLPLPHRYMFDEGYRTENFDLFRPSRNFCVIQIPLEQISLIIGMSDERSYRLVLVPIAG